MEPDRTIVTYVGLAIPFAGLTLGTLLTYIVTKHAREEREMLNRERLAAIEKGLDVPLFDLLKTAKKRTSPLSSALQTLAVGLGLSLPLIAFGPAAWMWGFLLALVGLAMLAHWFMGGRAEWEREQELDLALRQAYIARLRGAGAVPVGATEHRPVD
jgi:hypothetical protein